MTGAPGSVGSAGSRGEGRPARTGFRPREFRPAWWLPGRHAQTLGGKILRPTPRLPLQRVRIDTPDGDFLDLDISPPPSAAAVDRAAAGDSRRLARSPVTLVLHGLEGSARRPYALLAYQALHAHGITAVGLNFRGCSGEPNRGRRFYHSGETEDLRLVLDELAARFPGSPIGAIGFSLGGNVLLKYLGEEGDAASRRLTAAVAISVPFQLAAGAAALERGLVSRIYTYYFIRNLRRKMIALRDRLHGASGVDMDGAIRARTLREFDDALTAPLHGFRDAADYYHRSSSARYLAAIRLPTLLIQAEDDPFLPPAALPRETIAANPWLIPAISPRGGHVAFIAGSPWRPIFWAESEAARFLGGQLVGGTEAAVRSDGDTHDG